MINNTLKDFNDSIQSKSPTPGGGGVCACVSALSTSLATMVTNLTIGKKKYEEYTEELISIKEETINLSNELLSYIQKDEECFLPLSKAYSMDKNDPDYSSHLEQCLKLAASSPYQIMLLTCRVIDLCDRLSIIGSKLAISDAATCVMLCHGSLYGSYINVLVNTNLMKDKAYANNMNCICKKVLDEYSFKAISIFKKIEDRING